MITRDRTPPPRDKTPQPRGRTPPPRDRTPPGVADRLGEKSPPKPRAKSPLVQRPRTPPKINDGALLDECKKLAVSPVLRSLKPGPPFNQRATLPSRMDTTQRPRPPGVLAKEQPAPRQLHVSGTNTPATPQVRRSLTRSESPPTRATSPPRTSPPIVRVCAATSPQAPQQAPSAPELAPRVALGGPGAPLPPPAPDGARRPPQTEEELAAYFAALSDNLHGAARALRFLQGPRSSPTSEGGSSEATLKSPESGLLEGKSAEEFAAHFVSLSDSLQEAATALQATCAVSIPRNGNEAADSAEQRLVEENVALRAAIRDTSARLMRLEEEKRCFSAQAMVLDLVSRLWQVGCGEATTPQFRETCMLEARLWSTEQRTQKLSTENARIRTALRSLPDGGASVLARALGADAIDIGPSFESSSDSAVGLLVCQPVSYYTPASEALGNDAVELQHKLRGLQELRDAAVSSSPLENHEIFSSGPAGPSLLELH